MEEARNSDLVLRFRNADYEYTRLFAHIAIALTVTLTFLQLGNSLEALQYRTFAIFFVSVESCVSNMHIELT